MEAMWSIVLITCVVSLLSGILEALRPNEKFNRQMRFLLASVFLLAVLTPLAGGLHNLHWDLDTDVTISTELNDTLSQQTLMYAQENLAQSLVEYLGDNGITEAKAQVQMHIAEHDRIEIDQVTVWCTDPPAAQMLIQQCLGEEVILHVEDVS